MAGNIRVILRQPHIRYGHAVATLGEVITI